MSVSLGTGVAASGVALWYWHWELGRGGGGLCSAVARGEWGVIFIEYNGGWKTRNLEEQFGYTNSEQVDIVLKLNINAAFATAPSFYIEIFS